MTSFRVGNRVRLREDVDFSDYKHAADYNDLKDRRAIGVLNHNMNGVHFTVKFDTGLWLFRVDDMELASDAEVE